MGNCHKIPNRKNAGSLKIEHRDSFDRMLRVIATIKLANAVSRGVFELPHVHLLTHPYPLPSRTTNTARYTCQGKTQ